MVGKLKLAVAGVGNNIASLYQGVQFYASSRSLSELVGVNHNFIGPLHVSDVEVVAAFDIDVEKIGKPLNDAIFLGTNNYPQIVPKIEPSGCIVHQGISAGERELSSVVSVLKESGAEVLLYSLPTGLQWAATAYAKAALDAGIGFVNCTPEIVARDTEISKSFTDRCLPIIGDDLASHFGTSVLHRALLGLLKDRGITLSSSYQLNLGGNADFKNLREAGASKQKSKLNALAQEGVDMAKVEVIPSAGFVAQLHDNKVAYLNIEALGWGGTAISLDVKLKVQDSSNAAGVIIDLIRIAAIARRKGIGGFQPCSVSFLKSPPGGHTSFSHNLIANNFELIDQKN